MSRPTGHAASGGLNVPRARSHTVRMRPNRERVPGAELRLYEGGHAFFAQDPHALPDILDFLDG